MDVSWQSILILFLVLLFSMSVHEMMHAFASDFLGDDTARLQGRLSLNPLRHIDPIFTVALPLILLIEHSRFLFGAAKPVQVDFSRLRFGKFGGAIVGMIGPITNLVIASIAALIFGSVNPASGSTLYEVLELAIALNVGLFIFNSIPWPPLDGSRLLYAVAPRPLQELMESIEHSGLISIAIFLVIFYAVLWAPIGNLIVGLIHVLAPGLNLT